MTNPDLYEHFKPMNVDVSDGVYRVVRRDEEAVTLLRVADADERRTHTGEVVTVPIDEFTGFTPAENPDRNRPVGDILTSNLEMGYWSIRVFIQQLASTPLPTLGVIALGLGGVFGDRKFSCFEAIDHRADRVPDHRLRMTIEHLRRRLVDVEDVVVPIEDDECLLRGFATRVRAT